MNHFVRTLFAASMAAALSRIAVVLRIGEMSGRRGPAGIGARNRAEPSGGLSTTTEKR